MEVTTPMKLYNLLPRSNNPNAPRPEYSAEAALTQLSQAPLLSALESLKDTRQIQFHRREATFTWVTRNPEVASLYEATGDAEEPVQVAISLTRTNLPEGETAWLVKDWNLFQPDDEAN